MSLQITTNERMPEEDLNDCNSSLICAESDCSVLPDTQPTDSQCTTQSLVDDNEEDVWGKLYPTNYYKLRTQDLVLPVYRVGRANNCEITITEQEVGKLISNISKVQFKIWKESVSAGTHVTYLEDLSTNGTFVNKQEVGKNKKVIISNEDVISLAEQLNKAYVFVDTAVNKNWMPPLLQARYVDIAALGSGAYGEVKLVLEKRTTRKFAIKKIIKNGKNDLKILNEVRILQKLRHPCVIMLEDVHTTDESLFMVLEYAGGGELTKRLSVVKRMSSEEAKFTFYQLFLAVDYMHSQGITHRDLKPDNILFSSEGEDGQRLVKIADFGLSKFVDCMTALKTACGTPLYVAPEIIETNAHGTYTHQVDIWSLGVMLFQCLSGKLPFDVTGCLPLHEQIVRCAYSMRCSVWQKVSCNAVNLIKKMLVRDPVKRISVKEILKHLWFEDVKMKRKVSDLLSKSCYSDEENVDPGASVSKRPRVDIVQ